MKDMATIIGVTVEEFQSTTSDLAPAGATSLPVGLLVDFDPSGGSALLGDDLAVDPVVSYIDVDYDTYSIILEAPLAVAVDADTPVKCLNARGEVERSKKVLVDRGEDDDEDTIEATVDLRLDAHFPEGEELAGLWVEIESDGDEWRVVSTPFDAPDIDPDHVATPFFRAYLGANKTIPHNTDTILDGWVVTDNTGFTNPSPGYRMIYREGLYLIAGGLRWATAPTNRKAAGPSVLRANGTTETLWRDGRPNTGAVEESTAFAVPIRLYPGDQVYVVAWQNTGANLDVLGASGARLDMSFFSITWQGS